MTRIVSAKYKISRRLGVNLWGRAKDPFLTKNYPPGQHGPTLVSRKASEYGKQLAAKQKLKNYYGSVSERQFHNTFKKALNMKGDTGENLVGLLESRLASVVYRMNLAPTVFAARQLVSHKHILVNGHTVNISSYLVKVGDIISVRESSRNIPLIMEAVQTMERSVPNYIEFDPKEFEGKFTIVPKLMDIPYPVIMEVNLVVEFYSR